MGESTQEDLSNRQCIHTPPSTSDLPPSQSSLPPPFRWPSNLLFLTTLILPMKARIRSRGHFRPILTKSPKDQMHTRPLPSQSLRLPLRSYRPRTTSSGQRATPPFPRNSAISSTSSLQPRTSSPNLTLASKKSRLDTLSSPSTKLSSPSPRVRTPQVGTSSSTASLVSLRLAKICLRPRRT